MSRVYQRTSRVPLLVAAALLLCPDVHAATRPRTTPIVVRVEHGGFRFADAAIGAAAGAGAVLATLGGTALLRLRREGTDDRKKGEQQ
jgi:hypothetical protein